jgi:hypothetical protein
MTRVKISPYDADFVEKIKRSEQQIELGQYQAISTQDLWSADTLRHIVRSNFSKK